MFIENKRMVYDYCLRDNTPIYNTRKIGLTRTFGRNCCEDCLIMILRELRFICKQGECSLNNGYDYEAARKKWARKRRQLEKEKEQEKT